jgi:hypothetical protein
MADRDAEQAAARLEGYDGPFCPLCNGHDLMTWMTHDYDARMIREVSYTCNACAPRVKGYDWDEGRRFGHVRVWLTRERADELYLPQPRSL